MGDKLKIIYFMVRLNLVDINIDVKKISDKCHMQCSLFKVTESNFLLLFFTFCFILSLSLLYFCNILYT